MNVKITLVIPVYNTEKTLKRCIDSCINAFRDYWNQIEIIIINDGSPGDTQSIVDEYLSRYSNIRYFFQSNKGLSGARNKGVALSTGEYIWCIDSDDTITEACAACILKSLGTKADVYSVNYSFVDESGNLIREVRQDTHITTGKEVLKTYKQPLGVPFYILKRDFLHRNNLTFYEGIYHEDNLFNFQMLFRAETFEPIDIVAYNYYQYNNGTITSTPSLKRSLDLILIAEILYDFIMSNLEKRDAKQYSQYLGLCLTSACYNIKRIGYDDKKSFFVQMKSKSIFLINVFKIANFKYSIFIIYLLIQSLLYVKK